MKTFQGFIIWGNGTQYIEQILDIIRSNPNIHIKKILKKENIDVKKTIKHIYALDDYSKEHIAEKTNYLLTCKNEFFLIIVVNTDTLYREKPNKHKYLYHETIIKWKVRFLFNPKIKQIDIEPLLTTENLEKACLQKFNIPEVTHNHVIHSTDSEKELIHILKLFKIDLKKSKDYILGKILSNYPTILVNVDFLLVNTCDGDEKNIKDTPHYKYLLGEKDQYRKYILKYLGKIIKDDHLPSKYDQLIKNFKYGLKIDNIPQYIIVKQSSIPNKYTVIDGVHRLAILKKNNENIIKVYLENI